MAQYKYGQLNPLVKSKFNRRLETNSNNSIKNIREAARQSLYNTKLDIHGEFTGVVLKMIKPAEQNSDSISFVKRLWAGNPEPDSIQAKIRVPEIDALIPEPPEDKNDPLYTSLTDLHTTFTAIVADLNRSDLAEDSLVVVSYYDNAGVWNPQIKRVLSPGANKDVLSVSTGNAKTALTSNAVPSVSPAYGSTQVPELFTPINRTLEIPPNHVGKTRVEVFPAVPYKENRVRVHEGISSLPNDSNLAINVITRPEYGQQKLHGLVVNRFNAMRSAAAQSGFDLYVHSGLRAPAKTRWSSYEQYEKEQQARAKRQGITLKEAKATQAYLSPHEAGLALDLYVPATNENEVEIAPSHRGRPGGPANNEDYGGKTKTEQRKTSAHKWLKENAHLYGFTPLLSEPWHWECLLPIEAWKSGAEITPEFDISNYATRIVETSIANGSKTSDRNFTFE